MYSCEEKKRAVELFIKYDKSAAAAINELGHPKARGSLYAWYRDCISGDESFGDGRRSRYAEEQKAAAVNHYLEHGRCNAGTRRALGYPKSRTLLAEWIDELAPGSRKPAEGPKRFTCDQRREAVIDLVARKTPPRTWPTRTESPDASPTSGEIGFSARRAAWEPSWGTAIPRNSSCASRNQRNRFEGSGFERTSSRGPSSCWEKTRAPTRNG